MNYEKIKNELRLFFSWKQTKLDKTALMVDFDSVLTDCGVTKEQIKQFNIIWSKKDIQGVRFIARVASMLFVIFYIIDLII